MLTAANRPPSSREKFDQPARCLPPPTKHRPRNNLAIYSHDQIDHGKRDGSGGDAAAHQQQHRQPSPQHGPSEARSSGPEAPDMRREADRLETFAAWPLAFIDKSRLARTGLYYYGDADKVRCHFCRVEIGSWEEGDDPAVDHERWSPLCPLLRGHAFTNVPVGSSAGAESSVPAGYDECGSRQPSPTNGGPQRPQFALESARLQSFADWPSRMKQTPAAMADAGFVYTGSGDKTVCYYCGGGLKDWEDDDDPWVEHARLFPSCHYLRTVKGEEFIAKVHRARQAAEQGSSAGSDPAAAPALMNPAPALATSPAADSAMSRDEAKGEEADLCKMCYVCERNVCFVPCGHVFACPKCALSLTACPVCRKQFTSTMRLYYS